MSVDADQDADSYEAYPLSVDDIRAQLFALGISKSKDSIQRYCREGRLDCVKLGLFRRYYVTEASVDALVDLLVNDAEACSFMQVHEGETSGKSEPLRLHVPASVKNIAQPSDLDAAASTGMQADTGAGSITPLRESQKGKTDDQPLEPEEAITPPDPGMVDFLKDQLRVKDEQIRVKDEQIAGMLERDRETNILIRGLQDRIGEAFGLLVGGKNQSRDHGSDGGRYKI